jgi:hypothetical protein
MYICIYVFIYIHHLIELDFIDLVDICIYVYMYIQIYIYLYIHKFIEVFDDNKNNNYS